MGKIAFLFPGQGSQFVGMGKELYDADEKFAQIFQKADECLKYPLTEIMFNGPEETLKRTENTQPALLTMSVACLEAIKELEIEPDYVAGHSLGEYSALVAAEAMSFEDAVYAVRMRGLFMEEAVPSGEGTMAAVLGIEREDLEKVTKEITAQGYSVQLANLNCPGQIVISGTAKGVELAGEKAKQSGARRVIPLSVSGPFHSDLMKPAAEKLENILKEIAIKDSKIPIIANVSAKEMTKAEEIKENLVAQVYSPVLWEDSVRTLLQLGVDTFVEVGAGNVLSGLVRKIDRKVKVYQVSDRESAKKLKEALEHVEK